MTLSLSAAGDVTSLGHHLGPISAKTHKWFPTIEYLMKHECNMTKIFFCTSGNFIADTRYQRGAAAATDGDHAEAADMFAQTLEIAPGFAAAAFALAVAREKLGLEAGAAYALALALDPADELGAALHLARLGLRPTPQAAPQAYVARLFDAYAGRFDGHLSHTLAYRAPQVLAALVGERRFAAVLDLGCGTGLAGELFKIRCDRLAGVDLSPGMIAVARHKQLYDRLVVADLLAFLGGEPRASASLIIAADVFVYIGDLWAIFAQCARVLQPGGLMAFTLQKGEAGFSIGADLRYTHGAAHIADLAIKAGLRVEKSTDVSTRKDRGHDVPGLAFVLAKPHLQG